MVGQRPGLPSTSTILILDIGQESYHFAEIRDGWQEVLKGMRCPACGSDRLRHHSSYQKYLYEQRISILRLRCRRVWAYPGGDSLVVIAGHLGGHC